MGKVKSYIINGLGWASVASIASYAFFDYTWWVEIEGHKDALRAMFIFMIHFIPLILMFVRSDFLGELFDD